MRSFRAAQEHQNCLQQCQWDDFGLKTAQNRLWLHQRQRTTEFCSISKYPLHEAYPNLEWNSERSYDSLRSVTGHESKELKTESLCPGASHLQKSTACRRQFLLSQLNFHMRTITHFANGPSLGRVVCTPATTLKLSGMLRYTKYSIRMQYQNLGQSLDWGFRIISKSAESARVCTSIFSSRSRERELTC